MVVTSRQVVVAINLDLNKVQDQYIRDVFRQLIAQLSQTSTGQQIIREVTNNIVQRIPLDGSEQISGTILPDSSGTHNLGSSDAKFGEIHTGELFVDNNTLYVGGEPALRNDNGTVTLSSGLNKDVAIKARGTGKVIIDAETDVEITTTGNVTINDALVGVDINYLQRTYTPDMVVNTNQIVLEQVPKTESLTLYLNGIEEDNYTVNQNVITLGFSMEANEKVRAVYTY